MQFDVSFVIPIYVVISVSFSLLHVVEERSLSIILDPFAAMLSMCLLYVSLDSRVRPFFWGYISMFDVAFYKLSLVLSSARSVVNSVHFFCLGCVWCCMTWSGRKCKCYMWALAVCRLLCVAVILVSFTYVMSCVCLFGVDISEVFILKSGWKNTSLCRF